MTSVLELFRACRRVGLSWPCAVNVTFRAIFLTKKIK